MKLYIVVQSFSGRLVRRILADSSEEAKEIFQDKTPQAKQQLEDTAESPISYQEIHAYPKS